MSSGRLSRVSWAHLLYTASLALLCLSVFANYVLRDVGPDEGMYLGASYLAIDHEIYAEFSFFQTPYLPLLLSKFFRLTDVSHPFLWARIIAFVHHVAAVVLLVLIAFRYTKDIHVTGLFTLILGLNRVLYDGASSLHNVTFANAYSILGFYLILRAYLGNWTSVGLTAVSGMSIALAVGFKLTYLPILVSFVCVIVVYSVIKRSTDVVRGLLLPFAAGVAAGLLPLALIAADRFDDFRFNNVLWHSYLMGIAVEGAGGRSELIRGILQEIHFFVNCMKCVGLLALVVPSVVILVVKSSRARGMALREIVSFDRVLLAVIVFGTLVQFFLYVHVAYWYLGPLVLFSALLVPSCYPILDSSSKRAVTSMLAVSTAYMLLVQLPIIDNGVHALDRKQWIPLQYSETAARFTGVTPESAVAVLGNPAILYGVEAKLPLVSASATSAFTRLSSLMEPLPVNRARRYHIATYGSIQQTVESGEIDMLIVSWVYFSGKDQAQEADGFCGAGEDAFGDLVDSLCEAGFETEIVGRGSGKVVVFHKTRRRSRAR